MSMNITFLGTGTSHGVPTIDCMLDNYRFCPKNICRLSAQDPKHARTRSSLLVEWGGVFILIDVSLDFRQQALRERISRIDAVLLTHSHADHIGGMPDMRSYTGPERPPLPVYGSGETIDLLRKTFGYMFDPVTFVGGGIPRIETRVVSGPFTVAGKEIVPVSVTHGILRGCCGYRLGPLVYIPDMKKIDESELAKCAGAELLVLNCLRSEREHVSHMIMAESIALARRLRPGRCCFIHMCHDIHYEIDGRALDSWMEFAYDGQKITV
ncbi:MAG: MBL fold metallo-hydrolase [Chitinispirillaceae bacterium]|jgi:phosphoribosyl 1,2-cyclic phosphate phosphodiesterase|nr:MBL fold metallo-hydrolase [Chitinispirillaceae bacterium]